MPGPFDGRSPLTRPGDLLFAMAVAATALGALAVGAAELGPLSRHMAFHILLMNALAPLVAVMVRERACMMLGSVLALVMATVTQIIALWAAHAPWTMIALGHAHAVQLLLHALLFGLALWFWLAVVAQRGAARWRALVALLVTGKLACLLGVLLVFAPRELYPAVAPLADQQQAGLWMIAACMLSYVVAAIVIARRWLGELGLAPAGASR